MKHRIMATEKQKTYPKISRKMWALLRERFKKSQPSVVTTTLISSVSPMAEGSAKSNVLSPLRTFGIIDENDKPGELANRWRNDADYKAACHEIRKKIYPAELIEAFPDGTESEEAIQQWFMKLGVGAAAARMYADTYSLLSEGDVSKINVAKTAAKNESAKPPGQRASRKTEAKTAHTEVEQEPSRHGQRLPSIHIDVQVHISPDTTPDQIDRIFESMSKHLGTLK